MVRVCLRPALTALHTRSIARVVQQITTQHVFAAQHLVNNQSCVRLYSSRKDKAGRIKPSLADKVIDDEEEAMEIPDEVRFLNKPLSIPSYEDEDRPFDPELLRELEAAEFKAQKVVGNEDMDESELSRLTKMVQSQVDRDEDEMLERVDDQPRSMGRTRRLSDVQLAKLYERELATAKYMDDDGLKSDEVDDRLYIEMPNYHRDATMEMAADGEADDYEIDEDPDDVEEDEDEDDPEKFDEISRYDDGPMQPGRTYTPEMLNWMSPLNNQPTERPAAEKPNKYFERANHPDIVELALDVELLRLFLSPTGRIRPRRFTGLTAKQQRQLAQAVKISRQMAMLPYLSRYPEPSPEQKRAESERMMARMMEEYDSDEDSDWEDDDDEFMEELDEQ